MYLGIDIGTQSVKTLLYDPQRRAVAGVATSALELYSGADGSREQQAQWWVRGLHDSLSRLGRSERSAVKAIGVSGQQHGFVPLGADGEVLAPVKLWCDTSTQEECAQINAAMGGESACIAAAGNSVLVGYTASKIRWLKNHQPAAYSALTTIVLPHDYINFYLTGELAMEYGDASGTGLLDIRQRRWHSGMLEAVDDERDLGTALPRLLAAHESVGQLLPAVAGELGLPAGIPVATGGGDNMMAAIGTGNVATGRATVSLGTSGTLFAYSDVPVIDPAGSVAAFCSSTGGWLPLVCTMNCTVATELTRRQFGLDIDGAERAIAGAPAGSGGVVTLPFFNGERSPNLPNARGCILGLQPSNYTPGNLLRSAMESAVYGLRAGLEQLRALGCSIDGVRLTGGGAQSVSWRQMVADVFALPVSVQAVDEGAALGAALQAMWMLQARSDKRFSLPEQLDEHLLEDADRGCEPQADAVSAYSEHYENYRRHVNVISALYP